MRYPVRLKAAEEGGYVVTFPTFQRPLHRARMLKMRCCTPRTLWSQRSIFTLRIDVRFRLHRSRSAASGWSSYGQRLSQGAPAQ